MLNTLRAENLKFKRTFTRRLTLLAPAFFLLLALPSLALLQDQHLQPWRLLLSQIYNWWPVIFIPLGSGLLAGLAHQQEVRAGGYRAGRMLPLPAARLWTAKVAALAGRQLAAALILALVTALVGTLVADGPIPWGKLLESSLVIWWTSLALLPISLFVAYWLGLAGSVALGLVGSLGGVLAASTPFWLLVPWSWPVRLMCPIIHVHPNGVLLEPGSPLLDPGVITPGLAVSLAAFIALTALTAWRFARREVR
jgi:ABC-2 type transport system permease protein